jgi:outer membrane protein insertion porin family
MHLLRSMLLLCIAALIAFPQNKAQKYPPGTIHAVIIQGNKLYKSDDIAQALGIKRGEPATTAVFQAAQSRLLATDLFAHVAYEFRWTGQKPVEYDVTFTVREYDQLFPLRFEELEVPEDALRAYLRTHVQFYNDAIPGTDAVIRRYTEAAQQFVAETKPSLKIRGFVSNDDPAHPAVIIRPNTPVPTISAVLLTGSKLFNADVLQRAVNDVAVGQRFTDASIRAVLDHTVKAMYAAKGYVAVSFPKIQAEKSKQNEGYVVHVDIQEGPEFRFGTASFRGGSVDSEELRSRMPFHAGDVFDVEKVEQFRKTLVDTMRHQGHLDATAEVSQQQDDQKHAVNVTYSMNAGPQYTFQTLAVHGLDIESEPAIRKLWGPKPGKPFNPDYPDFFLNRVREMGLFDNLGTTKSNYKADDTTHSVTVDLYFRGAEGEAQKAKEKGLPTTTPGQNEPPKP